MRHCVVVAWSASTPAHRRGSAVAGWRALLLPVGVVYGPPWRSFASLKVRNWNRTRRFNDLRSSICLTDLHWLNRPPWRSIRQVSSLSKRKTQPTSSHRSPSPLITTRPAYPPMRHRPLTTACSPLLLAIAHPSQPTPPARGMIHSSRGVAHWKTMPFWCGMGSRL